MRRLAPFAPFLFALPVLAHPTRFDRLTFEVEDQATGERVRIVLPANTDGVYSFQRTLGGRTSELTYALNDEQRRLLNDQFPRTRLSELPTVGPMAAGQVVTLAVELNGRTYSHTTALSRAAARLRPLIAMFVDIAEQGAQPFPGERVRLTDTVYWTFGEPLPGHRAPLSIGGHQILNEPFASWMNEATEAQGQTQGVVALEGVIAASGGIRVEWMEAVATRELEVFLEWTPGGALVRTGFARVGPGKVLRVRERRGQFVRFTDGVLQDAFVRLSGVTFVQHPLPGPSIRGVVEDLGGGRVGVRTRRGDFPVRLAGSRPLAGWFDAMLRLIPGTEVTILGGYDPSARFIDAQAFVGRATVQLGRFAEGSVLRVRGFAGELSVVQPIDRPGDLPSFVRASSLFGLDLGYPTR